MEKASFGKMFLFLDYDIMIIEEKQGKMQGGMRMELAKLDLPNLPAAE